MMHNHSMMHMNHSMMTHPPHHGGHTTNSHGGHGSHNMSSHGGHGGTGHSSGHAGMMMWFHAGHDATVLFKTWKVDSVGDLVGTMIALFVLAILYEGLKVGREILKRNASKPLIIRETFDLNGDTGKKCPEAMTVVKSPRELLMSKLHLLQTVLHMLQVFLGYLLMLAFMTYNVWLCVAIILGAGSGYFLFGWNSVAISNLGDHCF